MVASIEPDVALLMWPDDLHHDHCLAGRLGFIPLRQGHRLHDQPFTIPEKILYYEAGSAHSLNFRPTVYVDKRKTRGKHVARAFAAGCRGRIDMGSGMQPDGGPIAFWGITVQNAPMIFQAIRQKRDWFYIDHSDIKSKRTFATIQVFFQLAAPAGGAAAPLLTLPAGG